MICKSCSSEDPSSERIKGIKEREGFNSFASLARTRQSYKNARAERCFTKIYAQQAWSSYKRTDTSAASKKRRAQSEVSQHGIYKGKYCCLHTLLMLQFLYRTTLKWRVCINSSHSWNVYSDSHHVCKLQTLWSAMCSPLLEKCTWTATAWSRLDFSPDEVEVMHPLQEAKQHASERKHSVEQYASFGASGVGIHLH